MFRAKTTSMSEIVRKMHHKYAVFLERVSRHPPQCEGSRRRRIVEEVGRPLVRVKNLTIDFRYFLLTGYSIEPT